MPPSHDREFFIFGSIVVYSRDRFFARQIYEEVNKQGLATQAGGKMSLHRGPEVNWENLAFEEKL